MKEKIKNWINCKILNFHEWTCNAEEGIKPTEKQLNSGISGFYDYAKMYCKHCKKESKFNNERL